MALLKIGDSPTLDLKANIQGASGSLMLLLKGDSDELREIIQTHMGNSFSLAKWFSLYIALLYEQLHRPEFYPRDEFLNTIGNIHVDNHRLKCV